MYIDKRLKKTLIPNKGIGIITTKNIDKGEIIIKDIPYTIKAKKFDSELFQLLYEILNDDDHIDKFMNLCPRTLEGIVIDKNKIIKKLSLLKHNNEQIYEYFMKKYDFDSILLFSAKYMCNAFEFDNKPSFLFTGTLLNHSCLPNVIFGEKDNGIVFMASRNIRIGEEICDNYIDITLNKNDRRLQLKSQYGFICNCFRCQNDNDNLNQNAIQIEHQRYNIFGYTKSKLVGNSVNLSKTYAKS